MSGEDAVERFCQAWFLDWDSVGERTKRIRRDQVRPAVAAAFAVEPAELVEADLSDTSADLHIEGDPQFKRRVEEERRAEPEVEAKQLERWTEYRLVVDGKGSTPVRTLDQLEGIEQNCEEGTAGAERQHRTVIQYKNGGEYRTAWEVMTDGG